MGHFLKNCVQNLLYTEGANLAKTQDFLSFQSNYFLKNQVQKLQYWANELPKLAAQSIKFENIQLDKTLAIIDLMRVESTLKRGFSITRKNGKVLMNLNEIENGDTIETQIADGFLTSKINNE